MENRFENLGKWRISLNYSLLRILKKKLSDNIENCWKIPMKMLFPLFVKGFHENYRFFLGWGNGG